MGEVECFNDEDCRVSDCLVGFCADFKCNPIMLPNGIDCDDNDLCTRDDTCDEGVCIGFLVECNDGERCTHDTCDPSTGCVHTEIAGCDDTYSPIGLEVGTTLPKPNVDYELAPPIAIPEAPAPPPNDPLQSQVIQEIEQEQEENENNNNDGVRDGESENKVIAQSSISFGAGLIGLGLVTCAGCFAMIFGVAATKGMEKDDVDRLDVVLDADEDILGTTVESAAFESPA